MRFFPDFSTSVEQLQRQVREDAAVALAEDRGDGDRSAIVADAGASGVAQIWCRSDDAVICGCPWVESALFQLDPQMEFDWLVPEGARASKNTAVLRVKGNVRAILTAERTALNFLQLLSATATAARNMVEQLSGKDIPIVLDTRKTLPMLRVAQKYATRMGGMTNHRYGLWDAAMVKENHITASGSLLRAVERIRRHWPHVYLIVEVSNMRELEQALDAEVPHVLLDNFTPGLMLQAVQFVAGRARLEVSGGISAADLSGLGQAGIDYVSIGAVTKHVQAIDFSLLLEKPAA